MLITFVRINITSLSLDISDTMIIGLTGLKRSGKDTIGNYLVENHKFIRLAFADSLKDACKIIFGFSDDQLHGDELKETIDANWKHTPREILQKVGCELFRDTLPNVCNNISNDIWIRSVERKLHNYIKQGFTRFVITDVRFPNEYDFVKSLKGIMINVNRASASNVLDVHQSETEINKLKCDIDIDNNSTIHELHNKVNKIIKNISK